MPGFEQGGRGGNRRSGGRPAGQGRPRQGGGGRSGGGQQGRSGDNYRGQGQQGSKRDGQRDDRRREQRPRKDEDRPFRGKDPRSAERKGSQDGGETSSQRPRRDEGAAGGERKPGGSRQERRPSTGGRPQRRDSGQRRDKGLRRDAGSKRDSGQPAAAVGEEHPHEREPAPELPEGADYTALDTEARRGLGSLPKSLAEMVGKHLAAAGMLVDTDPERALTHARYARARAARVAVVREAAGLTAYHAGEWAEALSELRAVRRMTGSNEHLAVMADCERAMNRPERALELAREARAMDLPRALAVELRIVAAGARRDLGQLDAAVVSLQGPDLHPDRRDSWSARLFYAYADNLLAVGRVDEAVSWFLHADDADTDGETDAGQRAVELAESAALGPDPGSADVPAPTQDP
ncbi:MAG: hypothetical protein ACRDRN_13560 [Sciscionella sp.]